MPNIKAFIEEQQKKEMVTKKPEPKMDIRTAEQKATGKRSLEAELTKGKVPTIYR